ncbi:MULTISPECIES: hypothetical protein [unclassified Pseudomonas]|uniref:hypothetical protein n=1 Tax=unclassified Pseudomonas TaxID=196821 RepID=UPI0010677C19|nr:hypothetical protein [Pseudomonas sp. SXM-1]QBQ12835.1 hypothetical protein DCC84_25275 [Pseudomonas sp. SXM-1]
MQKLERLNQQLGFETWAADEGFDLTTADGETTYTDIRTFDAWRGYLAAQDQLNTQPTDQLLYAEIKKSSKYASQIEMCRTHPCGYPFRVSIHEDFGGYVVNGGIGGRYRLADVNLYVINDSGKIRLN